MASWNEWSPLREVVLGSAVHYRQHVRDLSFDLFFHDNICEIPAYYPSIGRVGRQAPEGQAPVTLNVKRRYVEELVEDVEGIREVLEARGVRVLRPLDLPAADVAVATPWWSSPVLPPLNVRDNTLVIGDEIVETPPMLRARYAETQFLKPVFQRYFEQGARWTVMPRPVMTDASFDASYANRFRGNTELIEPGKEGTLDIGLEMMLDAAQCLRFGRDVIVNIATENHRLAVDWLDRHFEGRVRFHRIVQLTDSHVDSMLMPLRPGTLLLRSARVREFLPEPLRSWDVIVAPEASSRDFPPYDEHDLLVASTAIDVNVLSLDEDTVIVNEASVDLLRVLEKAGFTVVPVRHRHRRLFGGGFHCVTLDTVRDGGPETYLE